MFWNSYIPLEIPNAESMTEEEFFKFCAANKHIKIEKDENYQILIMPPAGLESDNQSGHVFAALYVWNLKTKSGVCFGSSAGFTLPDSSVRSLDAAWVSKEKWNALPEDDRKKFGHITPDFVAEVMSPSDDLIYLQNKMQVWIKNGVRLGWLIVPEKELAYIYRADATVSRIAGFNNIVSGEDVLPGFSFDLSILKSST